MIEFDYEDLAKAGFALGAGMVLGLEREIKDKAAGIKTITIICLGACLFSILSYKMNLANPTALAAYIVSGVGFIGAGTIFKEGATISGLTTAGIIWLSAAVGTAIGFGQYGLSIIFILASLVMIVSVWLFEKYLTRIRQHKRYRFTITVNGTDALDKLTAELDKKGIDLEIKSMKKEQGLLVVACETIVDSDKIDNFTQWALNHEQVTELQV